jgi:hypothetical protein
MFGGNVWHRGPAVGANSRAIISLVACKNDRDVNHDSATPYPWQRKTAAPLSSYPGVKPIGAVAPAELEYIATSLTSPFLFDNLAKDNRNCANVPVQQSRSASVQVEAGGALRTVLDDPRPASGKSASTVDYRESDAGQVLVSTAEGLDGSGKDDAGAGRGGSNRAAVGMDCGAAEAEGMVQATDEKTMTQQQKGLVDTPRRKEVGMAG